MKIYIETDANSNVTGWGITPFNSNNIEVEIPDDHPLLTGDFYPCKLENGELVIATELMLSEAKKRKNKELNAMCAQSILSGFQYTINGVKYWFSFDTEAQLNFQGIERLFSKGTISEINWTVRVGDKDGEYVRIILTKEIMDGLQFAILRHKDEKVSMYRDILLPQVESATSVEEVNAVTWNFQLRGSVGLDGK
jgi:hypothetical protein